MNIIEQLNWRYATKVFDKTKKISPENFNEILEAFRLTPTSLGFQHHELLVIESTEIREKLLAYSWNQKQVTDASHYLVFCTKNELLEEDIVKHVEYISKVREIPLEKVLPYGERIRHFMSVKTDTQINWLGQQIFIALGNVLTTCAVKGIDSCAIGGFQADKYTEVLNLKEKGLTPLVCLAVGYRSEEDTYQLLNKVRKPLNELVRYI